MVMGSLRIATSNGQTRNSALYYGGDGKLRAVYDKQLLVPFGEYMPLRDTFPSLVKLVAGDCVKLRSGNRLMVFAEDATPVPDAVHQLDGGDRRPVIVRPANLEDVFLSVTGTQLGDGQ